jgi:hypothetical protein
MAVITLDRINPTETYDADGNLMALLYRWRIGSIGAAISDTVQTPLFDPSSLQGGGGSFYPIPKRAIFRHRSNSASTDVRRFSDENGSLLTGKFATNTMVALYTTASGNIYGMETECYGQSVQGAIVAATAPVTTNDLMEIIFKYD